MPVKEILHSDPIAYGWDGLNQFRNEEHVFNLLKHLHKVDDRYSENVKKQARQIRYCVAQSHEYFSLSRQASFLTRPVALYYSTMLLAVTEVLVQQTGASSLDKARQQHKHHGLLASIPNPSTFLNSSFHQISESIRATPAIKNGGRFGTFELWHLSARHLSNVGLETIHVGNGLTKTTYKSLMAFPNERLPAVPNTGINLFECFSMVPRLIDLLGSYGISSDLVRGRIERHVFENEKRLDVMFILHPNHPTKIENIIKRMAFPACEFEGVNVRGEPGSVVVTHSQKYGDYQYGTHIVSHYPDGLNDNRDDVYFYPFEAPLNEFGYFFVGLFIIGSLARYFPDIWIREHERFTTLAHCIDRYLDIAARRVPILALSALTNSVLVERVVR